jgi:hypothetical protein
MRPEGLRAIVPTFVLAMLLACAPGTEPATAQSPEPSAALTSCDRAIAAVRSVDPRFIDIPDYDEVNRRVLATFDLTPLLAGSWIRVLPTFQPCGESATDDPDPQWIDLGLGQVVEVMLVSDCQTVGNDLEPRPVRDPCAWRRQWIYRVLPTGDVVLVAAGGSADQ